MLEAGNYVPADLRLLETVNLKIEEASLTGKSVPVNKDARLVLDREIPLGDRKNSAFMGTLISYGRGVGLVTATGMHTQIGMIAEMIQSYDEEDTPLQQKLDQLGKVLGIVSLLICAIIFLYGIIRDTNPGMALTAGLSAYLGAHSRDIIELFMTAVSLAIAAVPEGLPAVVTICLALGMQRMVRRHSLIRKLPAVETLGCATVICSDKTGTLTQNEMTVVQGWSGGRSFLVNGEGYNPIGTFTDFNGRGLEPCRKGRSKCCSMEPCSAVTPAWNEAALIMALPPGVWLGTRPRVHWSWQPPRRVWTRIVSRKNTGAYKNCHSTQNANAC